jgi:sulfoxide reductase heme-binding subunit YedZ
MLAPLAAVDVSDHLFWITSRAAGVSALILSSVAVAIGLTMGSKLVRGSRVADARSLHEVLSLATMVAIVLHVVTLFGDAFLHPSVLDLTIPFVSGYSRWWTTAGIVAGWMTVLLGLSYYARGRIGAKRWRSAHRFTALAWVLGVAHSLGEGTDAGTTWFLAMTAIVVIPPLLLLGVRLIGPTVRRPIERTSHAA